MKTMTEQLMACVALGKAITETLNRDRILEVILTRLSAIVAARNLPADGPDDVRDADGDGILGHLDARVCTLRCTNPSCALSTAGSGATPASSCGLGFELALLLPILRRLRSKRRRPRSNDPRGDV